MNILRSLLVSAVSLSIVVAAPGSSAYAELAKSGARSGFTGGSPIAVPKVAGLGSALSVPGLSSLKTVDVKTAGLTVSAAQLPALSQTPVSASAVQPGAAAQALKARSAAAVPGLSAASAAQPEAAQTLAERLAQPLPELTNVSDASAKDVSAADFANRIGESEQLKLPESSVVAGGASSSVSTLSASSGKASKPGKLVPALKSFAAKAGLSKPAALFGAAFGAAAMLGGAAVGFGDSAVGKLVLVFSILIPSLILHEIAHARAAARLGDKTAVLGDRGSFNPLKWGTHIDPMFTLLIPMMTFFFSGFIFGGARPVPVQTGNLRNPVGGMALVALAGPAMNFLLAGLGALAFTFMTAAGAAPLLITIAGTFTMLNAMLGVFNLLPVFPLDGHHILRWMLPQSMASRLDDFYQRSGMLAWIPAIVLIMVGVKMGILGALYMAVTGFLLTGAGAIVAAVAAAVPALGLSVAMLGQVNKMAPPTLNPGAPVSVDSVQQAPSTELIVILDGAPKVIPEDAHLSFVDVTAPEGVNLYSGTQQKMLAALSSAGVTPDVLASYNATPIATYRRINAATLRLDADKAAALKADLEARGHKVFANSERRIIVPVPVNPEEAEPQNRGAVSMSENLAISKAVSVQQIAESRWGKPGNVGAFRRAWRRIFGTEQAPQTPVAVVDTGADITHPQLSRGVKAKNVTSEDDKDDNGHGTWVTSMVRNFAKWNNNVTSYKTFVNGGATLDDILKALTAAANDGNIVISNSWGSDDGDPNGPDSQLVKKLAEEGHIMVFAAGNAGPRANSIGSPAIVVHRTADGTPRVTSVAAAQRDKKIASFSSRGPRSPMTKNQPDYPVRPDLAALGYNTKGAWPNDKRGDEVDPVLGNLRAISGTSMATPAVAGAIALLAQLFNVTTVGPRLDAVVKAVMDTLEKTGQSRDAEGEGFINVEAAYKALEAVLGPSRPVKKLWSFFRR